MPVRARKRVIVNKFKEILYWLTLGSLKLCFSSEAMPVARIQGSTTCHPKGLVWGPPFGAIPCWEATVLSGVSRLKIANALCTQTGCANVDYPFSS